MAWGGDPPCGFDPCPKMLAYEGLHTSSLKARPTSGQEGHCLGSSPRPRVTGTRLTLRERPPSWGRAALKGHIRLGVQKWGRGPSLGPHSAHTESQSSCAQLQFSRASTPPRTSHLPTAPSQRC